MSESAKPSAPGAKALSVLQAVFDGEHLKQALQTQCDPASRQTALVGELCYGVCRYYFALLATLDLLLKRPLPEKHRDLRLIACLGLYQLQHTRQKAYAVVNETVKLTTACGKAWASGLLNAVLRRFIREGDAIMQRLADNPIYSTAMPPWLFEQLQGQEGVDRAFFQSLLQKPKLHIRLNLNQTTLAEFQQALEAREIGYSTSPHLPAALAITDRINPTALPGFDQGWYVIQDHGAQKAVSYLDLGSNQRVLDACCAPGGKLMQLAEGLPERATLLGLDTDCKRMSKVEENLQRLQLAQVGVKVADAADLPSWWDGQAYDRILLDAPCSATGVIARHPDIKIHRSPADVAQIRLQQQRLLEAMVKILKPGGLLLYVTCSVLAEENQQQIDALLQAHPEILQQLPLPDGSDGLQSDGSGAWFYYALLRRS